MLSQLRLSLLLGNLCLNEVANQNWWINLKLVFLIVASCYIDLICYGTITAYSWRINRPMALQKSILSLLISCALDTFSISCTFNISCIIFLTPRIFFACGSLLSCATLQQDRQIIMIFACILLNSSSLSANECTLNLDHCLLAIN